jgi:riboflavin kinase/FMN adenylyltransferase
VNLIQNLDRLPDTLLAGAVTIGNFDGVHRGHARIVERLLARAQQVGGPAVVFTFEPHPVGLLRPAETPPPLTWIDRKAELLNALGVDAVVAYPTNRQLLTLSPEEFFDLIIRQRLQAKALVEGPNFFFGRNRAGDVDLLNQLCQRHLVQLEIVEPLLADGSYVSSSRIRELIQTGHVREADQLLTQPYRVRGSVVRGAGRGASIGFATANLDPREICLPAIGVYAGRAQLGQQVFPAAINIGPNPTFGENAVKFETHLVGIERTLYGELLEVEFLDRLRDVCTFANVEALKQQLHEDVAATIEIAGRGEGETR